MREMSERERRTDREREREGVEKHMEGVGGVLGMALAISQQNQIIPFHEHTYTLERALLRPVAH